MQSGWMPLIPEPKGPGTHLQLGQLGAAFGMDP